MKEDAVERMDYMHLPLRSPSAELGKTLGLSTNAFTHRVGFAAGSRKVRREERPEGRPKMGASKSEVVKARKAGKCQRCGSKADPLYTVRFTDKARTKVKAEKA